MARVKGAINKKDRGTGMVISVGMIPTKPEKMQKEAMKTAPKMAKAKGKTTSQGAKMSSRMPKKPMM